MSLDVYLTLENACVPETGITIREHGEIKLISREEWDSRFPGREPAVSATEPDPDEVYWANITHNLNTMAGEAGIYKELWRPDEIDVTLAAQLIEPLEVGLKRLEDDPARYQQFNPKNGWGTYAGLVSFVRRYLAACKQYPTATIRISR